MASQNWFERLRSAFTAMVRRQGLLARHAGDGTPSTEGGLAGQLADRQRDAGAALRAAFRDRLGPDPDLSWMDPLLETQSGFESLMEMVQLLGMRQCPYEPDKILEWLRLGVPTSTLYAVIELVRPKAPEDLDDLYDAIALNPARLQPERLVAVANIFQRLNRPLAISNLMVALETLSRGSDTEGNTFYVIAEAYAAQGIVDPRLDRLLLERLNDEEATAAAAAFVDVVSHHLEKDTPFNEVEGLLTALRDRVAVRRLSRVLELFDEHKVSAGTLDTFHLTFATSQTDLLWLERALTGMSDLGRGVDRLVLIQLREWAPEVGALGRYMMAARAFMGLGLSNDEIDRLVLKRVETEEKSQVLGLLGDVWVRLGFGTLTFERAEHLADLLNDRVKVKRYETAVTLLKELKLPTGDIEVLSETFLGDSDDINWLETLLASAGDFSERLNRIQLFHLRERCPEPPQLYRYFKLKRMFEWFSGDKAGLDAWLLDMAPHPEEIQTLVALGEIMQDAVDRPNLEDLKRLHEQFGVNMELIEAYGTCVRTFNGHWRKFSQFLAQVSESGDLNASLELISQTLTGGRTGGANQFERAVETVVTYQRMALTDPPGTPRAKERGNAW